MSHDKVTITSEVRKQLVDKGSKSERSAAVVDFGGRIVALRLAQAPSFGDHSFDGLVGKRIKVEGILMSGVLIVRSMDDVTVLEQAPRRSGPAPG